MSYELSVTPDFFTGVDYIWSIKPSNYPKNCLQSLISLEKYEQKYFLAMIKDILNIDYTKDQEISESVYFDFLDKIRETNECKNLNTPVIVYIDKNHVYSIEVYD